MLKIRKFYVKDIEKIQRDLDITDMVIYVDYVHRSNHIGRAYEIIPHRFKVRGYTHYIQVDRIHAEIGLHESLIRIDVRKTIMHELRHLWQFKHNKYPNYESTKEYKLYKRKKISYEDLPWEQDCSAYEMEYDRVFSE